jgi:hypothetical protein
MTNAWSPGKNPKKTKIGKGKHSKFKTLGSNGIAPKGYRKKNRGQGKQ